MIMKIINKGKATLKEIEEYYTIEDLFFLNACIDVKNELEFIG